MQILTITGSLREGSTTTALAHSIAKLAPPDCEVVLWGKLGELPFFSPELDIEPAPQSVQNLREMVRAADVVLVFTPEYAHGIPGSLKNALDWLVSSGEFDGKPTGAVSSSPSHRGGDRALESLFQTLEALNAHVPDGPIVAIPAVRTKFDENGMLTDSETVELLKELLDILMELAES